MSVERGQRQASSLTSGSYRGLGLCVVHCAPKTCVCVPVTSSGVVYATCVYERECARGLASFGACAYVRVRASIWCAPSRVTIASPGLRLCAGFVRLRS